MAELDAERRQVEDKLSACRAGLERALDAFRALYGVGEAGVPPPPKPVPARAAKPHAARPASAAGAPKRRGGRGKGWSKTPEWTDADLTTDSTDLQRRILWSFVQAGKRTRGLAEVAASTGVSSQRAWGALSGFIAPVKVKRKEPILEITEPDRIERERRGVLITVVEKYWPMLQRLYGGQQAPGGGSEQD